MRQVLQSFDRHSLMTPQALRKRGHFAWRYKLRRHRSLAGAGGIFVVQCARISFHLVPAHAIRFHQFDDTVQPFDNRTIELLRRAHGQPLAKLRNPLSQGILPRMTLRRRSVAFLYRNLPSLFERVLMQLSPLNARMRDLLQPQLFSRLGLSAVSYSPRDT